jgi:hypothetical protein
MADMQLLILVHEPRIDKFGGPRGPSSDSNRANTSSLDQRWDEVGNPTENPRVRHSKYLQDSSVDHTTLDVFLTN